MGVLFLRLLFLRLLRSDYLTVLEALTTAHNPEPFVAFAHKLIEINSRMPFGSFEESHQYFRQTGALDEPSSSSFGLLPYLEKRQQ